MIELDPIGFVHNSRDSLDDDNWGEVESVIELSSRFAPECFDGIEAFSHLEIIFVFDRVAEDAVCAGSRRPRGNPEWPKVGIFAQRAKDRPNRLGATIVELSRREGTQLYVQGLDAVDGTPVLDIKPVMVEFLPRRDTIQPEWASALMSSYWTARPNAR